MLVRNCTGGVVFCKDKVFLLKNDKGEWVLPRSVVRNGDIPSMAALDWVREDAGIQAQIILTAGQTNFEFHSITRQRPVWNRITWYLMKSPDEGYRICKDDKFTDGGYFNIDEALEKISSGQDRAIVNLSFNKLKQIV